MSTRHAVVRRHPAVAEATVTEDGTVWIVPDGRTAPMLSRSTEIELGVLAWHEPADGLRVAGINRRETDFLYRELFTDDAYFRRGIALPAGAVVVDVGANIGMFTLRAAEVSRGARIVAVEPVAELADAVRINARLHDVDATVVCAAMGDAETTAEFTFYPHNSVMSGRFADATADRAVLEGYLRTDAESDGTGLDRLVSDRLVAERRRVPVTTLAAVAAEHGLDRIDLLKVDAEKAELQILAGVGEQLWPRIDRIVAEVHDIDGRLAAVVELLRGRGFHVETDQDPRLALTPCHSVYAYRPAPAASLATVEPGRPYRGPTTREIERELPFAATVVAVRDLNEARARADAPVASSRRTEVVAEAWAALFGAAAVRPDANFFDVGGTSLAALRLLERVEQQLGPDVLTLESIFATSTFAALVATVDTGEPT